MSVDVKLSGRRVIDAKITLAWRGVWSADLVLDLDSVADMPSGAASLTIGDAAYACVVDPRGSGTFVSFATARVVGGMGGWDKSVPAQDFVSPLGLLTSDVVYSATAGLVSETVLDSGPASFGARFSRSAGPASRIFQDRQWYVDPATGVTFVADWPSSTLTADTTILSYDPISQVVETASDTLIYPGTVLSGDSRLNGQTLIVRDVEQRYTREGTSALLWCSPVAVSRLSSAMQNMVREFAQVAYLKTYLYRFVLTVPGGMALQAITPGAPDLNPIEQWTGLAGATADLFLGTQMVVGFVDQQTPYIISFSPMTSTPLTAPTGITLGVDVANPAQLLATKSLVDALDTFCTSLTAPPVTTVGQIVAAAVALKTSIELPGITTTITKGA